MEVKDITNRDVDFAKWYTDVCRKADLVDYSSVKGSMIIRPYGYAIWENIQNYADKRFKEEIENTNEWTVEALSQVINNVKEKAGVKGKMLFMPIRIAASGIMHGPELADTLYLIGKEEILNRLEK